MGIDFSEFEQLIENFEDVRKAHEQFIRNFLTEMGLRALTKTKKLTPVDTGDLRNRWELSQVYRRGDELYVVLFNPLEYASFVEDGHKQHKRFLPLKCLEGDGSTVRSKELAASLRAKYGEDIEGIMLQEKWIPGIHMARISITQIEREIPRRYERALRQFMHDMGAGD